MRGMVHEFGLLERMRFYPNASTHPLQTDGWSVASWHSFTCTEVTSVKAILHVADPMVVRMVGLRIVDHSTGRVSVLPTLNTPFWEAKATPEGYSVVVLLDSEATRRGGIKDLPSSEWNLHIITDVPVQGLSTDVKTSPFLKLKVKSIEYKTNDKYLVRIREHSQHRKHRSSYDADLIPPTCLMFD